MLAGTISWYNCCASLPGRVGVESVPAVVVVLPVMEEEVVVVVVVLVVVLLPANIRV